MLWGTWSNALLISRPTTLTSLATFHLEQVVLEAEQSITDSTPFIEAKLSDIRDRERVQKITHVRLPHF